MSLICSRVRTSGNDVCDGNGGAWNVLVEVARAFGDVEELVGVVATRRGSLGFAYPGAYSG